jgi:hypothetical protein
VAREVAGNPFQVLPILWLGNKAFSAVKYMIGPIYSRGVFSPEKKIIITRLLDYCGGFELFKIPV